MASYSVLSLDGGGSWALIQVKILQQRYGEKTKGHEILRKYDLVIANSGGSLVLAAMCVDKGLDEILKMFLDDKILKSIFVRKTISYIPYLNKFLPRFKTSEKVIGLRKQLGPLSDKALSEFPDLIKKPSLQIVITGFDYDRERAIYFRSKKDSRMDTGVIQCEVDPSVKPEAFKTPSLLNAVHAASNAPVMFFDDPAEFAFIYPDAPPGSPLPSKRRYWDGAVGGNNNPVASGVLEALANGAGKDDIRIVSIGTANTLQPVLYGDLNEPTPQYNWLVKKGKNLGTILDLNKMAQSIISDPPDAATFIANQLLGLRYVQENPKLIRINPLVKPILSGQKWMAPGDKWEEKKMKRLFELDMAVTDKDDIMLIHKMTEDYFAGHFHNQGIRTGSSAVEAILGHKDFKSAMRDWKSWGD